LSENESVIVNEMSHASPSHLLVMVIGSVSEMLISIWIWIGFRFRFGFSIQNEKENEKASAIEIWIVMLIVPSP